MRSAQPQAQDHSRTSAMPNGVQREVISIMFDGQNSSTCTAHRGQFVHSQAFFRHFSSHSPHHRLQIVTMDYAQLWQSFYTSAGVQLLALIPVYYGAVNTLTIPSRYRLHYDGLNEKKTPVAKPTPRSWSVIMAVHNAYIVMSLFFIAGGTSNAPTFVFVLTPSDRPLSEPKARGNQHA